MKFFKKILFAFIAFLISDSCFAQIGIQEQSSYLDSVLSQLNSIEDSELRLLVINQQLNLKSALIEQHKKKMEQLEKDFDNTQKYHARLASQLDSEKSIYASLVVKASRIHSLMLQNFDVFSFDNLYKSYRQFLYIKWLTDYRLKKIKRIKSLKTEIVNVLVEKDKIAAKQDIVAKQLGVEQSFIQRYTKSRASVIESLKNEGSKATVENQTLDSAKIKQIAGTKESNDEASILFQIQKGYLKWPVKKGVIIRYFGESPDPVHDKVTIMNEGLDFLVSSQSKVQCVYNGVVAKIFNLPHNQYSVIVRHGNYFTVYSGMEHILVSVGDKINKDDVLGDFDTENKNSVLKFQIWNGAQVINPYDWLIKYPK